jgi:flagellar protein FliO/FliZ
MRPILFLAFLMLSNSVFAGATASSANTSMPSSIPPAFKEPFSGEALIQLVVGLCVVVAIIFILSWVLKRFSGISSMTKNMRVVGVLPLSAREKAVLVKVGQQHLLLGVAPGRVSRLHAFEPDEIEEANDKKADSFSNRLAEVVKQRRASEEKSGDRDE